MARRGPHHPEISWYPHIRVAWGGTLGGGAAEIWGNSMKYVCLPDVEPTIPQLEQMLPAVSAPLLTWFRGAQGNAGTSDPASFISTAAKLTFLKINYILATGLQRDQATVQVDIANVNGNSSGLVPYYQTFAVTMRTQLKRGRCHAGRFFPPVVALPVADDGMCPVNYSSAMANAAGTLIKGINDTMGAIVPGKVCVLSPGNTTKGQGAMYQEVLYTEVDRTPDTQHRRTNRMIRSIGATPSVSA